MALFGLLSDNGPLSSPDAQLALAAGLLSGRGNWGANLSQGLLAANSAQQQERANRQNDLQQIQGLYKIALTNDQLQASYDEDSGRQHVRDPMLSTLEQKMAHLGGMPSLSNQGPVASRVPGVPPQQGQPPSQGLLPGMPQAQAPMPGMAPPSASPMASPDYQPAPGDVQQRVQATAQQTQQQQQSALQQRMQALQRQGDRYAIMGMTPIAQERYKQLEPITTKYGVYFRDPLHPGQVVLGGGMVPKDAMPVTIGPNGEQSIAPLPGQLVTAAQNAAAQSLGSAAGKFPFETTTVERASGGHVPALTSSIVGQPNIGGLPLLSSIFGSQSPTGQPNQATQPQGNSGSGVAQLTVTQPSKQAQAVPAAAADPWATIPKRPQPQGIGQSTYDATMTKLQADTASRLAEKYGATADTAQQRIALNNQALELVDRSDTGMGATALGDVKNLLVSRFGIPESDFKNDPAATVALNKDLMSAAVAKAKASFGARMSTNEVNNMLKRGAPNGDMLSSAIKFLLNTDNATAQYQIQQGNNFGRYLSSGGDPMQFESWHAKTFPLSQTLDQMHLPPNTSQNNNPNYGWKVERVQ